MMALTNIELYEALTKVLSEDAARMIAEVVPPTAELATKADIARLERQVGDLKGYIDSRLLRFTLAFFIPMWGMTAGILGVLLSRL